jgi:hypothetical protein
LNTRIQNIGIITSILVIFFAGIIWAGYERDIDDILHQRLDRTGMSADSIKMVMALPRSLIDWEKDGAVCATYLDVGPFVAAAALVNVEKECFDKKVLFNYTGIGRKD